VHAREQPIACAGKEGRGCGQVWVPLGCMQAATLPSLGCMQAATLPSLDCPKGRVPHCCSCRGLPRMPGCYLACRLHQPFTLRNARASPTSWNTRYTSSSTYSTCGHHDVAAKGAGACERSPLREGPSMCTYTCHTKHNETRPTTHQHAVHQAPYNRVWAHHGGARPVHHAVAAVAVNEAGRGGAYGGAGCEGSSAIAFALAGR